MTSTSPSAALPPTPPAAPFPARRAPGAAPALGTVVTLPDPRIVELCVLAGCDWVFVDCEHGAIAPADLGRVLVGRRGAPALVRLPANEEQAVKQALDAGADGIICPRVEDAATARRLVSWAKYPPLGERSVGIGRAHSYGLGFAAHVAGANAATSVVVQIESRAGVRDIERIAAVPGVGGVLVGPYDLSGSLGRVGRVDDPEVRAAVRHVVEVCAGGGVPVGQFFAGDAALRADDLRDRYDFAAVGIDTSVLAARLAAMLAAARAPEAVRGAAATG